VPPSARRLIVVGDRDIPDALRSLLAFGVQ
jgi:hypothetical protein